MHKNILFKYKKLIGSLYFKDLYKNILEQEPLGNSLQSITLLSHRWNTPSQKNKVFEIELGLITLLGWISYTIFDHCLDGQHNAKKYIPLAERSIRELHWRLAIICKTTAEYKIVTELLSLIETAHKTEIEGLVPPPWHKSAGHMIGPLILTMQQGYTQKSAVFVATKIYFIEFLTIKQLSDDLRDWEEDWKAKRKTVVTEHINKLLIKSKYKNARAVYTLNTLPYFCKILIHRGNIALKAFKKTKAHKDSEHFIKTIKRLQNGAENALNILSESEVKASK